MPQMQVYDTKVYDSFYSRMMIGAELKFAWLPQTCDISGELIWLKYASIGKLLRGVYGTANKYVLPLLVIAFFISSLL